MMKWPSILFLTAIIAVWLAQSFGVAYGENAEAVSTQQNSRTNQGGPGNAATIITHPIQAKQKAAHNIPKNPDYWFAGWGLSDRIAVIASVVAFLQFLALVGTILVMERSSRRELRAYVAGVPYFMTAFDEHSPPKISIKLLNVGATPALRLQHRVQIELLIHPYKKGMELPPASGTFGPPLALFPNTEFFGYRTRSQCFSAAEIADIRAERVRIYVYGELEYLDIFKRPHTTLFCHAVVADAETLKKLTSSYKPNDLQIHYELAPMGNDAD